MRDDEPVEQLQDVRSSQRIEAAKQKAAMQQLLSTEGWQMMAAFLREQIRGRQGQVFCDPECKFIDYVRGEVGMALLFEKYPQTVIDAADAALGALDQESRHGSGDQRTSRRAPDPELDDTSGWTPDDD
jgi:hypothetical protein